MRREKFKVGEEEWTRLDFSPDNRTILVSTTGNYMKLLSSLTAKNIGEDLTGHVPANFNHGPTRGAFLDGVVLSGTSEVGEIKRWAYTDSGNGPIFPIHGKGKHRILQERKNIRETYRGHYKASYKATRPPNCVGF